MRLLDLSFDEPAMNLALDEALLNDAEGGHSGEVLRFWESPVPFVVLGVAQRLGEHVFEEACREDAIPIHRRCSAGGCVLQGPGCLNFSLVLDQAKRPEMGTIRGSYDAVLGRICRALETRGVHAEQAGTSDLAVGGGKVSGNAQRRRKAFILHHGTLLYRANKGLMERYLKEPGGRPAYRGERPHSRFVRDLPLAPDEIRSILREAFWVVGGGEEADQALLKRVFQLAQDKYLSSEWVRRL